MARIAAGLALLLLIAAAAAAAAAMDQSDYQDLQTLLRIISKPRRLERQQSMNTVFGIDAGKVQAFSWKNCGSHTDPLQLKSLSLNPDPIKLSGAANVSFSIGATVQLDSPVTVELTIKKKIGSWIEIPCINNAGSCTYEDVCELLIIVECPPPFIKAKIPCLCPYKPATYTLPTTPFTFPPPYNLPSWLVSGDFQVTARLTRKGQPMGCIFIQLSLTE